MWGIRCSRGCAAASAGAGWRRPEVVEHEVANVAAELLAGHEVDHGVLPGENPVRAPRTAGAQEALGHDHQGHR